MIVSAHQPAYLPWLGFFHKISLCDTFVYYDHVDISNKDYTKRNKIKTSQGEMWLTVPTKKGASKKICDLIIDESIPWRRVHLKSVKNSYSKSQYFKDYINEFEDFYSKKHLNFSDMNLELTKILLNILNLDVNILRSSDMNISGKKNDGIYDLMKKLNANKLVFGINGKDYVNLDEYNQRGIHCYFQNYCHPTYPQRYKNFIPYLSIFDLVFNCGPNSLQIITDNNISKNELFK